MKTKVCSKCGIEKSIFEFHKQKSGKFGVRGICKNCLKQYRQDNKDRFKKYDKNYYDINTKKLRQKSKDYYKIHKVKIRKLAEKNKEKTCQFSSNWYQRNKERLRPIRAKYQKDRKQNDIIFKIRSNITTRIYDAIKNSSKSLSTMFLIGCEVDYLLYHIQKQFTKNMNWDNYGDWHIDHKQPCASFDLSKSKEQIKCFNYTNLQPLWAIDNLRKGSKIL